jgi:hypothetical protein
MKNLKKFVCGVLLALLAFAFVGCGNTGTSNSESVSSETGTSNSLPAMIYHMEGLPSAFIFNGIIYEETYDATIDAQTEVIGYIADRSKYEELQKEYPDSEIVFCQQTLKKKQYEDVYNYSGYVEIRLAKGHSQEEYICVYEGDYTIVYVNPAYSAE